MNKILVTTGNNTFFETEFKIPDLTDDSIQVKSIFTGICRSDIDMMQGNFGPLPLHMQGHEGLGQVIGIGKNIYDVKIGDYVATRGEPAYADVYNVRKNEYVKVPKADPKYILEPVACGINLIIQAENGIIERQGSNRRLLILGSGFLAWIAYHTLLIRDFEYDIDVVGSSNRDLWGSKLKSNPTGTYDVIIDLSSRADVFESVIYNDNALIILGTQKQVNTDFGNMLWKSVTMVFPSPRTPNFYKCMEYAAIWIENEKIIVDKFWTRGYNRDTEWGSAFSDGVNRPDGYSRGYLYWNNNGN